MKNYNLPKGLVDVNGIPVPKSFPNQADMCDIIRGQLPIISSNGVEEELVINDNLQIVKQIIPYNISDICYINSNSIHFWLGVNRINTPHWTNPYETTQNFESLPPSSK